MSTEQPPKTSSDSKGSSLIRNEQFLEATLEFVQAISGTIVNVNRYPPGSAAISMAIERAIKSLNEAFEFSATISLGQADDLLLIDDTVLGEKIQKRGYVQGFVKNLVGRQVQSISFDKGLDEEELVQFLRVLGTRREDLDKEGTLHEVMNKRGITKIKVDEKIYIALAKDQAVANKSDLERLASSGGMNISAEGVSSGMFIKFLMSKLPIDDLQNIDYSDRQINEMREEDFPKVARAIAMAIEGQTLSVGRGGDEHEDGEVAQGARIKNLTDTIVKVSQTIAKFPQPEVQTKLIDNFLKVVVNFQPHTLTRVLVDTIDEDVSKIGIKKRIIEHIGPDKRADILEVIQENYTSIIGGIAPDDFEVKREVVLESARVLAALLDISAKLGETQMLDRGKKMIQTAEVLVREMAKPEGLLLIKLKRLITQPPAELIKPEVSKHLPGLMDRVISHNRYDVAKRLLEHVGDNLKVASADDRITAARVLSAGLVKLVRSQKPLSIDDGLKMLTSGIAKEQQPEVRLVELQELGGLIDEAIDARAFGSLTKLIDYLPALKKALNGSDEQAAKALATVDAKISSNRELVMQLIESYGGNNDAQSRTAEKAIMSIDRAKLGSQLLDLLRDSDDRRARKKCLTLLSKMARQLQNELLSRAANPDNQWYFDRNLALLLGDAGTPQAIAAIDKLLDHNEERVRKACVQSLIKINSGQANDLLIKSIDDSSSIIRRQVVNHFRTNSSRKAVDRLIALIKDSAVVYSQPHEDLVLDVCQALGKIGDPRAIEPLAECLKPDGLFARNKKSDNVMVAAANALGDIKNDEAQTVLAKNKRHRKSAVAQAIKQILS
ncbi:MAG: HEAT repeat domain-containing protein [Candidatus Alcyoniella australis]|nr:HEAT repeat domain-containing protein [Candidatus Alcyoniella australis]